MELFYFTFRGDHCLANHWVEVVADEEITARLVMQQEFPKVWSGCYDRIPGAATFPGGKLLRIKAWQEGDLNLARWLRDDELLGLAEISSQEPPLIAKGTTWFDTTDGTTKRKTEDGWEVVHEIIEDVF